MAALRLIAIAATCLAVLACAPRANAAPGDVLFKECHSDDGSAGACRDETLLISPYDIAVSPDGRHAYVSTWVGDGTFNGSLLIYDRNPLTGRLTRRTGAANCYRDTPVAGDCTNVESMARPLDVQVSPNGKWVYVAAYGSSGIAVFNRNATTGRLTQKPGPQGCLKIGGNGTTCKAGRALQQVIQLIPSPDFRNLYATSFTASGSIAILKINPNTGEISQDQTIDGCVTETGVDDGGQACTDGTAIGLGFQVAVSPDGRNVYGASQNPQAVTIFNRNTNGGGLTQLNGTAGCISVNGFPDGAMVNRCQVQPNLSITNVTRISRDGRFLYAFSGHGSMGSVVTFSRNAANGTLSFVRCLNEAGNNGCGDARMVSGVESASFSPDGRALAVLNALNNTSPGLSFFNVNPTNGVLTQRPGLAGCVSKTGNAPDGVGGTLAGVCAARPALGDEGNVDYFSNTTLYTAALNGGAFVFDRDFAPVCDSRSVTIRRNTSTAIGLSCRDANADPLTLQIVSSPGVGSLGAINQPAQSVFYSPFLNYTGPDSFRYRALARGIPSAPATVSITVPKPPRPKPKPIRIAVGFSYLAFSDHTVLTKLQVTRLPRGTRLRATCRVRGHKCSGKAGKAFLKKRARGKVSLASRFVDVNLPIGAKITIVATKPRAVGAVKILTMRPRLAPKVTTRCLRPGSKKPRRKC